MTIPTRAVPTENGRDMLMTGSGQHTPPMRGGAGVP